MIFYIEVTVYIGQAFCAYLFFCRLISEWRKKISKLKELYDSEEDEDGFEDLFLS